MKLLLEAAFVVAAVLFAIWLLGHAVIDLLWFMGV